MTDNKIKPTHLLEFSIGKDEKLLMGANTVGNLRRYWKISVFHKPSTAPEGELLTVHKAAEILGVVPSTVHRWLIDGFISGEQITPGAPWQIRITDELRSRFIEKEIDGYVPMIDATRILGVPDHFATCKAR